MGSNQNRFGDKKIGGGSEWGSKPRKESNAQRHAALDRFAINDSELSNKVKAPEEIGYEQDQIGLDEGYYLPPSPKKRRKKNTRRWCRGKEGQEHDLKVFKKWSWSTMKVARCDRCGKEFWSMRVLRATQED